MANVYIVVDGDCDFVAAFSARWKAEEFVAQCSAGNARIEEMPLDKLQPVIVCTVCVDAKGRVICSSSTIDVLDNGVFSNGSDTIGGSTSDAAIGRSVKGFDAALRAARGRLKEGAQSEP